MTVELHPALQFRTSTRCGSGGCVEVALLPGGGAIVRDTKDRTVGLMFDGQEWADSVAGVKDGEFDF